MISEAGYASVCFYRNTGGVAEFAGLGITTTFNITSVDQSASNNGQHNHMRSHGCLINTD